MNPRIARLVARFQGQNAINVPTADIYIQKVPGTPSGARGVPDLEYEVVINGRVTQSGRTGNDGLIKVRVPAGPAPVLRVMGSEYEISITNAAFANVNTTKGKKERLRYLGYQIGHAGANGNGVDDENQRFEYERSILDFQAAHGLDLNSDPASIEAELRNQAGG